MKKCNKPGCGACPFILEGKEVKSTFNATSVKINCPVNCETENLVYGIFCKKENCKQIYIGKTERKLKERLSEHVNSVKKNEKNVIGQHFNGPGHSLANLQITTIENFLIRGHR